MRRRDHRLKYLILGLFVAVGSLTFLLGHLRSNDVDAASLANFDPGFIISDYTMSNYNSMTQAEIQAFLTNKNPCDNHDYAYYQALTANNPGVIWHWKDGHFVCISEELFGDGMVIGEGKTAAQIIYETAQEYKINPQVLLVLIQKESSLITDPIPNNYDYRAMTGFGCPDTAPCDAKYFGFKNQIRKAAWLFREVLDGGWTNYPLGENYVQYNPNAGCGGSIVNIRSLATSALYRYTPYQPNAGAIAAGYGTAYCGAYGNRNFYLYFEDWVGGITDEKVILGEYQNMVVPRVLYVKNTARYIDRDTKKIGIRQFSSFEYFTHLNYEGGNLCLSISDGGNCYLYTDLEELDYSTIGPMSVNRMLIVKNPKAIDFVNRTTTNVNKDKVIFTHKIQLNNQLCLIANELGDNKCILYEQLSEIPNYNFSEMNTPRRLYIQTQTEAINIKTGVSRKVNLREKEFFNTLLYWFGDLCLHTDSLGVDECVLYVNLTELKQIQPEKMAVPRFFKINDGATLYDAEMEKNTANKAYEESRIVFFDQKITTSAGLCLKSANITDDQSAECVLYNNLSEIDNFSKMEIPRIISIRPEARLFNIEKSSYEEDILMPKEEFFTEKITLSDGSLCLRGNDETQNNQYKCIKYSDLSE